MGYRAGNPFDMKSLTRLGRKNFDILHVHCPAASGLLARLMRVSKTRYVPIVFTYHTKFDVELNKYFPFTPVRRISTAFLLANIRAADEVWVVSKVAGENLRQLGYAGEFRVMENGTDFARGRASDAAVGKLKEELGIADQAPVFLFVGRIQWYKGLRLYLDAFRRYLDSGRKGHLVIVGSGQELPEVKAYAQELGVTDACCFPGMVSDRELLRTYYSMASLFLLVNTFDTSGIVVKEAAACDLPSVVLEDSGPSEGMTDGRNGLIIQNDAEELCGIMEKAADDPEGIRLIGTAAGKELYLSWEDAVGRARQRYEEIVEKFRDQEEMRTELDWDLVMQEMDTFINRLESGRRMDHREDMDHRDELDQRDDINRYP